MSYPRSLEEFSTEELATEIRRRKACRSRGVCDYCERLLSVTPACKFPERHNIAPARTVDTMGSMDEWGPRTYRNSNSEDGK